MTGVSGRAGKQLYFAMANSAPLIISRSFLHILSEK